MAGNIVDVYCESILTDDLKTATVYLELFDASPTDTGSLANECTGTDYARVEITFGTDADGRSISNTAIVEFAVAGGDWGTLTHFGIADASTAGNLLWWGPLSPNKTIDEDDQLKAPVGNLTVSFTAS